MSASKKLIPRRRFKWFEKSKEFCQIEWQKLVERLTVMSSAHCLPRVEFEDIISGQGELNKDVFKKINDKRGIEFKKGDILFGKLRPYLKNWLYAGFDGIAVGDFWVFRPTFSNGGFIYALIQTNQYQKVANQSTGTKMPRSDWNIVSNTKFIVTTNKIEQTQIGEFFKKLDNLINTQQKKLEKAKTLKSAYLREMFPNEGELKPRLRFTGFNISWKEKKLEEITKTTIGEFVIKTKQNPNSPYPVYNGGISYTGFYDEFNNEANKIVISARGANAGFINIVRNRYWAGNSCYSINIINNTLLSIDYLFYSLKRNQHFFTQNQQAANIPSVSKKEVETFTVLLTNITEQTKIGNFFKLLDDKIALEQKKLDKLKNIKQAYLNEMFV